MAKKSFRQRKIIKTGYIVLFIIMLFLIFMWFTKTTDFNQKEEGQLYNKITQISLKTTEQIECNENYECKDCKVSITCMTTYIDNNSNEYIYIKVRNQFNINGDCYLNLYFKEDNKFILNKRYSLGIIEHDITKAYRIELMFPENKTTEFQLIPECDWVTS